MKLSEIQSGVVIDDQEKIANFLHNRDGKRIAAKEVPPLVGPGQPQTMLVERGDKLTILKAAPLTPGRIGEGAPAVPTGEGLKKLFAARGMDFQPGYEKRVVPYWASDESVDSYGDIVRQNWVFDSFERNSPMQWDHEWWAEPIGRHIDWKIMERSADDYNGKALWILAFFATKEMNERAESVFRLVKAGLLPSGSVGFRSLKIINVEDEAERAKLGLGKWGVVLDKNELLEFSSTPLGANKGAHSLAMKAMKSGDLNPVDIFTWREQHRLAVVRSDNSLNRFSQTELAVLDIARTLWPDLRAEFVPHGELDKSLFLDQEFKHVLRAEVPDENIDGINERLDAIATAVQDFGGSITAVVEDMRTLLEGTVEDKPDGEDTPADGEGDADSKSRRQTEEQVHRLTANLEALDKHRHQTTS